MQEYKENKENICANLVGIKETSLGNPALCLFHGLRDSEDMLEVLHGRSVLGVTHVLLPTLIQSLTQARYTHQACLQFTQAVRWRFYGIS